MVGIRPNEYQWAIELALATAKRSTCCRRNVGCVLLNEKGHVLATGYNGVAAGKPHCNELQVDVESDGKNEYVVDYYPNACPGAKAESGTKLDQCYAIHAEQNALLQCKDVHEIDKCFVTTSPCITCAKLLLNTSCKEIIFLDKYKDSDEVQEVWTPRKWTHWKSEV